MKELIDNLREFIISESENSSFLHNDWFVRYHLNILERIALELCDIYTDADRNMVLALVWLHDYGKILDMEKQHDQQMVEISANKLTELGFEQNFILRFRNYLEAFEKKMEIDLHTAPIEVQIVSSAGAASHMIGPFYMIYWKEYSIKTIDKLLADNIEKLTKDWERKITLPEIKELFQDRYSYMLEQTGKFPEKFLA